MKLVEDQKGYTTNHVIINGNGIYPEKLILEKICEKYDGADKIILYPRTGLKRQSGLSALKSIRSFLDLGFRNFIFIVDGEYIKKDAIVEIKKSLIGIRSQQETLLKNAYLFKCEKGNVKFKLYCIIMGPDICIEQEVAGFLEITLNIKIDIPEDVDARNLKKILSQIANKKKLKKLLKESGRRKLEQSFPRICTVLKVVENDFLQKL